MTFEEIKKDFRSGGMCSVCVNCNDEIEFLIAKIERMQAAILEQIDIDNLHDLSVYEVVFNREDLQDFFDVEVKE